MRLRNIPGADDAILNSEYCIKKSRGAERALAGLL